MSNTNNNGVRTGLWAMEYAKGMRVVIEGMYLREGVPVGVVGFVIKPPGRGTMGRVQVSAYDGGSWCSLRPIDARGSATQYVRPLTAEEREQLDAAMHLPSKIDGRLRELPKQF